MKLIKPYYEIITHIDGEQILKEIELAARTCYKSEGAIEFDYDTFYGEWFNRNFPDDPIERITNAKSAKKLIPKLLEKHHEAMLEFGGTIHVKLVCDRGVSHELVRHRIASYAQESTRYCNYGKDEHITFIIPSWINDNECLIDQFIGEHTIDKVHEESDGNPCYTETNTEMWFMQMLSAERSYNYLIKNNWTPQQARSVLPNSLKTEINITANIREWRHIFKLRTANTAHPQMRELMRPLLDEFQSKIPILFDDIVY